ncbi:MAG: UvrD-helicase domain-containing protein [Vicinamibacterales bacterium]
MSRPLRGSQATRGRARFPGPADQGARPRARRRGRAPSFRQRFRVLLVDEFQDTDPLQAELLLMLAGEDDAAGVRRALLEPGRSSSSATRSSPSTGSGAQTSARTRASPTRSAEGAQPVTLQTSYRSVPAIQRFVNAAFSVEMTGDRATLQADYVSLAAHRPDHERQPAIVALPLASPYGRRDITQGALAACQPGAIGRVLRWLVSDACGWTVDAPDPSNAGARTRRPIAPRDICLLFRRFMSFGEDVTRDYVDALEARGIPHLLVGGRTFHEREEVDAIRTALTAIEWPEDELSVTPPCTGRCSPSAKRSCSSTTPSRTGFGRTTYSRGCRTGCGRSRPRCPR